MLARTLSTALLACFCLSHLSLAQGVQNPSGPATPSSDALAQDYENAVIPITSVKLRGPLVEAEFGTGFCIDPGCEFIGTNYHVAANVRHLKIKGVRIIQRLLATGPNDEGATLNDIADGSSLRYTLSRDLAVFQLDKPLRNHHGLQFSTEDLNIGQRVRIYAYPKGTINPFRSLQEFDGVFVGQGTDDLLQFDYVPNGDKRLRPGASGGIVVDGGSGKVVGIFCGFAKSDQRLVAAVPVESLAEFLNKVQPFLAGTVFPIQTEAKWDQPDFYPEYEAEPGQLGEPQHRTAASDESDAVKLLREHAQSLADGMRDFIAVQTYTWGSGNDHVEAANAYEVQVRDGLQKFREYPDGKKWRGEPTSIPGDPHAGIIPGDDWSTLPLYIGTKVGMKIREVPGASFNGQRIRIFQFLGSAEDEPCQSDFDDNFVFFSIHKEVNATPYGEVWTDQNENIERISMHCEDHYGHWGGDETIITYGWLTKPGVERRLVPVTIVIEAPYKNKLYWCRGQFVDYREFVSRARALPVRLNDAGHGNTN